MPDDFDPDFCFYDEEGYERDADAESLQLRLFHARLWSKDASEGPLMFMPDQGARTLTCTLADGTTLRVSSDTIATSHSGYTEMRPLHAGLPGDYRNDIERKFYRMAGFIVFPVHPQSLNQLRGWRLRDRFDLTLECIRRHYTGEAHPLADVMTQGAKFFGLFGSGHTGFVRYVEFFHLQGLVADGSVRWFDGSSTTPDLDAARLPATTDNYRAYLDNVAEFTDDRTDRIRTWLTQ